MNLRTLALMMMLGAPLLAHDLYLMPESFFPAPGKLVCMLHTGDSFPEGEVAMNVERLRDLRLTSKAGTLDLTNARKGEKASMADAVVIGAGTMILSGRSIPNLIELEPAKFVEYLKEEGMTETIAWREKNGEAAKPGRERYSKYFKSLVQVGQPDDTYKKNLGLTIEILPEANPYSLKPGQSLPVQVLFRGKPAADLQIELAWASGKESDLKAMGRTNAQGRLTLPLMRAGKYRVHSIVMERCADKQAADWESFWASMTFEIR